MKYLSKNRMLRYINIDVKDSDKFTIESVLWAYLSKRVKEELGEETTWDSDKELYDLFKPIQREDEGGIEFQLALDNFSGIEDTLELGYGTAESLDSLLSNHSSLDNSHYGDV